jgi:hypothetical protein
VMKTDTAVAILAVTHRTRCGNGRTYRNTLLNTCMIIRSTAAAGLPVHIGIGNPSVCVPWHYFLRFIRISCGVLMPDTNQDHRNGRK